MRADISPLLLRGFLRNDVPAVEEFSRVAGPTVRAFARRFGRDLPADRIDEVVSETYLILLEGLGSKFDSNHGTGSVRSLLFWAVKRAVQRIRAQYAQAGSRTRRKTGEPAPLRAIGFDHVYDEAKIAKVDGVLGQVELEHDAQTVINAASATIAAALIAIYFRNRRIADVAKELGVSRFKLHRDLATFAGIMRHSCGACRRTHHSLKR